MTKAEELEKLLKEKLKVETIDRDASLASYNLDSLDIVEFLLDLEDKYGVSFEADETKDVRTAGEMFDLILRKIDK